MPKDLPKRNEMLGSYKNLYTKADWFISPKTGKKPNVSKLESKYISLHSYTGTRLGNRKKLTTTTKENKELLIKEISNTWEETSLKGRMHRVWAPDVILEKAKHLCVRAEHTSVGATCWGRGRADYKWAQVSEWRLLYMFTVVVVTWLHLCSSIG